MANIFKMGFKSEFLFLKKCGTKNQKNSKNQSEIAASEQKIFSEKANFLFKHRFLTLHSNSSEKIHAVKPLAFLLQFLFRRDQNHYSNLASKIMKMCEKIFTKTTPQYNTNSLNCEKTKRSAILAPAIAVWVLKRV